MRPNLVDSKVFVWEMVGLFGASLISLRINRNQNHIQIISFEKISPIEKCLGFWWLFYHWWQHSQRLPTLVSLRMIMFALKPDSMEKPYPIVRSNANQIKQIIRNRSAPQTETLMNRFVIWKSLTAGQPNSHQIQLSRTCAPLSTLNCIAVLLKPIGNSAEADIRSVRPTASTFRTRSVQVCP